MAEAQQNQVDLVGSLISRTAAVRVKDVPDEVKYALNHGLVESKNLAEVLALDTRMLFSEVLCEIFSQLKIDSGVKSQYLSMYEVYAAQKIMAQLRGAARVLSDLSSAAQFSNSQTLIFNYLAKHTSDTVRSWACFMLEIRSFAESPQEAIRQRFAALLPFADDSHMGVRECAWMALRPHLVENWDGSNKFLRTWLQHASANVRRTAIEACRPRGVWCTHFQLLKEHPELALDLLELVKADTSRYVQNSVANWLNDAGKSRPEWVINVCAQWEREGALSETQYIIRRALRNLR